MFQLKNTSQLIGAKLGNKAFVLLDLDDTLFAEKDYFKSVFETFASKAGIQIGLIADYMTSFSEVRSNVTDIFSHFLRMFGLYSEKNHQNLFDIYVNLEISLTPYDGVDRFIDSLVGDGVGISVLTNGVPQAQKNKWLSLKIGEKSVINFYAARDLYCDKPNEITYELWRSHQKVEWSNVIAIGDKYENDVRYPFSMGAQAIHIDHSKHQRSIHGLRFKIASDFSSAAEIAKLLIGQI